MYVQFDERKMISHLEKIRIEIRIKIKNACVKTQWRRSNDC